MTQKQFNFLTFLESARQGHGVNLTLAEQARYAYVLPTCQRNGWIRIWKTTVAKVALIAEMTPLGRKEMQKARIEREPHRGIIKWVGGKTGLLPELVSRLPRDWQTRRYCEPFFGGGALGLWLLAQPRHAEVLISDANPELINLYTVVRDDVESLIKVLSKMQDEYRALGEGLEGQKVYYYKQRAEVPIEPVKVAARTIFLNKTCFNGLYRVNRKGLFNSPHGSMKNPLICDEARLREASRLLTPAQIECLDFLVAIDRLLPGDMVYCDPPYVPTSPSASFTSYTEGEFGLVQQKALGAILRHAEAHDVWWMASNSFTPLVKEVYGGWSRLETVSAKRAVNSDGEGRAEVQEYIIRSQGFLP